jgi:hypothetical protein
VKSTLSGQEKFQSSRQGNIVSNRMAGDTKRKREDVSPAEAPRGPKVMKSNNGAVDLTGDDQPLMQTDPAPPRPGMGVRRPSGGANRAGSAGGVIAKRKPKDSDVFLKRK